MVLARPSRRRKVRGALPAGERIARDAKHAVSHPTLDLYPGTSVVVEVSQEEIGSPAGLPRQRINKALKRLEDPGLLRLSYNTIQVLDLSRVREHGREASHSR
jgi:CRP-like cAMP-binding protein